MRKLIAALGFLALIACSSTTKTEQKSDGLPFVDREFRAAWVATVANINWPSRPGLPVDSQKIEAINQLDLIQSMNFNAVVFQVRPQADALYKSELEPWSYFLTGEQGKAPEPYYDPLEFWITEAHARGLDLHVWLNPYRAHHTMGGPISEKSVVKKYPDIIHELSSGYYWFEPTSKVTQDHSIAVIKDIVKRYDIDGVHMDDYFYPYPSYHNADFPDGKSYAAYQKSGGKLTLGDWRRDGVNQFVKRAYETIKQEKPNVLFGLSPFGIYRPNDPVSIKGFDQYEKLYADVKLWMQEGWADYFSPQLYWAINQVPQSFPVLLGWWDKVNTKHRHLWPGISVYKDSVNVAIDEAFNQIMITRGMVPNSPGVVHWSLKPYQTKPKLAEAMWKGPYKTKALIPASPWLDKKEPVAPEIESTTMGMNTFVKWTHPEKNELSRIVLFTRYGGNWEYQILPTNSEVITIFNQREIPQLVPDSLKKEPVLEYLEAVKLKVVDKAGNMSKASK